MGNVVEIEKCCPGHYFTETEEEFLNKDKKENIFKDKEDQKKGRKLSQIEEKKGSLKRGYILYFGKKQRR